jgi:hypothetical protein
MLHLLEDGGADVAAESLRGDDLDARGKTSLPPAEGILHSIRIAAACLADAGNTIG